MCLTWSEERVKIWTLSETVICIPHSVLITVQEINSQHTFKMLKETGSWGGRGEGRNRKKIHSSLLPNIVHRSKVENSYEPSKWYEKDYNMQIWKAAYHHHCQYYHPPPPHHHHHHLVPVVFYSLSVKFLLSTFSLEVFHSYFVVGFKSHILSVCISSSICI